MSTRIPSEDTWVTMMFLGKLEGKISAATNDSVMENIYFNRYWYVAGGYSDFADVLEDQSWDQDEFEDQLRLPKNSAPQNYKLHLDARNIHTGSTDFKGEVEIDVLIKEDSDYVMMHSHDQVIETLQVFYKNGSSAPVLDFHLYEGFLFVEGDYGILILFSSMIFLIFIVTLRFKKISPQKISLRN